MTAPADEVCERLHAAGLRMTDQRRRIVALFAASGRWCTPQELHERAGAAGVHAGLATVYRLIEALVGAGLSRSFTDGGRTVRYVFCPPGHHHHLICTHCGCVSDVTECHVSPPAVDFDVQAHAVDFFGACAGCRGAQTRAAGGSAGARPTAP